MATNMTGGESSKFTNALNTIAAGQAMIAAVKDYQKEYLSSDDASTANEAKLDVQEMLDDPELQKLHEARIAKIREDREKRAELSRKGHGTYQEIEEGEFLDTVTKTELVVCHFFHKEFESCKIMDKHLQQLAYKYFETRFVKLSAPDAPFFSTKLNVKVLPCIICFRDGVAVDRVVGFEQFGGAYDFPTTALENLLTMTGVLKAKPVELPDDVHITSIRRGSNFQKTASDEDSDFDD